MSTPAREAPAICLLGGESSGKTSLANALHRLLTAQYGLRVTRVPEFLRAWCEEHQRAPLVHEQLSIATTQAEMVSAAKKLPGAQLVICDTSASMIAAYSELYFNDLSLWSGALQTQRRFDATLLMGLDLPWKPDGLFRDSPAVRAATDTLLRRELEGADLPFQTVYGAGDQRLNNALRALSPILTPMLGKAPVATSLRQSAGRPGWVCEACSDPDCEHRLFTSLLKTRP